MKSPRLFKVAAVIAAVVMTSTIGTQAFSARPEHSFQASRAQQSQQAQDSKISIESAAVNLDVLVTDQDGRVLSGLSKANFRVLDNGKPQRITQFEPVSAPITIAMLMEYSGIAYDYYAYKAASWGSTFLDHLDPLDWVALVTYDLKPTVRLDFTKSKGEVQQVLSQLSYPQFREANLYDALIDTLDRLDRVKGKKAVLLISTGSNTFGAATLDDTLKRIKQSGVTIFSVGLAEGEFQRSQVAGVRSVSYLQAKNQLETFAKISGGMAWFPRFDGEMPDVFESVAAFLRSQYAISFSPDNLAHDGKYHKLKVEIVNSDGSPLTVVTPKGKKQKPQVYAREGYTAPLQRTGAS
jgi:VWFA-related protein